MLAIGWQDWHPSDVKSTMTLPVASPAFFLIFPVVSSISLHATLWLRNREKGQIKMIHYLSDKFPTEACHSLIFNRCGHHACEHPSVIAWCQILNRKILFRYVATTRGYLVWSLDQGDDWQTRKRPENLQEKISQEIIMSITRWSHVNVTHVSGTSHAQSRAKHFTVVPRDI